MTAARILLAEDEKHLRDGIRLNLELEGHHVVEAGSGTDALTVFRAGRFDLVILDIMMPGLDGIAVCEAIRLEDRATPILFLTARDGSSDRVLGLRTGADDYLTKPFNLEELLLRVRNLIRRGKAEERPEAAVFRFGKCSVHFGAWEVTARDGRKHRLSKKEIMLLKLLTDRKNQVVSRQQILENVWGYDVYPSTRTMDNFIVAFRKIFEENPRRPQYFHSVRGVGYRFTDGGGQ